MVAALLFAVAAAHLLLPLAPLREAQAIDPGLADLILLAAAAAANPAGPWLWRGAGR